MNQLTGGVDKSSVGMMGDTGHSWHGRGGDDGLDGTMGMIEGD